MSQTDLILQTSPKNMFPEIKDGSDADFDYSDDEDLTTVVIDQKEVVSGLTLAKIESITNTRDQFEKEKELTKEIEKLGRQSVNHDVGTCITIVHKSTVVFVPQTSVISDDLACSLWGVPQQYSETALAHEITSEIFHYEPHPDAATCKVAFLNAQYSKTQDDMENKFRNDVRNREEFGYKSLNNNGLFTFTGFAGVVLDRGYITDFAIHGRRSNIVEMCKVNKVSKVYYKATPGDHLDTFLKHPSNPFIELKNKLVPVRLAELQNFNPKFFCPEQAAICPGCKSIKDALSFAVLGVQTPYNTLKKPQFFQDASKEMSVYKPANLGVHPPRIICECHLNKTAFNRVQPPMVDEYDNSYHQNKGVKRQRNFRSQPYKKFKNDSQTNYYNQPQHEPDYHSKNYWNAGDYRRGDKPYDRRY